jgi:hypothetical protein
MNGEMDGDRDGLPDSWEIANGTDPAVADAAIDADGDGLTNLQEFIAGTNPRDRASSLGFQGVSQTNGQVTLTFVARANRAYSIQFTTSLGGGWSSLADVAARNVERIESVTDSTMGQRRYYRIVTPVP